MCGLVIMDFYLSCKTLISIVKTNLQVFLFHYSMILLYNHEPSTWSLCMQETLPVESPACRRRGRRTRATNIPGRNISMAPRNIQMAAMDSPLFDYVVLYFLLNNMYGGQ